jgi:hypothetical protein
MSPPLPCHMCVCKYNIFLKFLTGHSDKPAHHVDLFRCGLLLVNGTKIGHDHNYDNLRSLYLVTSRHSLASEGMREIRAETPYWFKGRKVRFWLAIISTHVQSIFYYFVLWPINAKVIDKLSHCYMFRHCCVILRELVINTLQVTLRL